MSDLDWELLDWDLLDRYLAGEATAAEREQFDRWLAARPERAAQLAGFRRALDTLETDVPANEREAIWSALLDGAVEGPAPQSAAPFRSQPATRTPTRARRHAMLGIAAALVAVGVALGGRAWLRKGSTAHGPERVVAVPHGQQVNIQLEDGTKVILGAGSTLRYAEGFATGARDVVLEGEAYFAVAHDTRRPFRVRAGDLIATDLGTEFLVRAYPEDRGGRVVVRSGLVGVRSGLPQGMAKGEQTVRPGELGRLTKDGTPVVEAADTSAYFAWTRGTLAFDGTPLSDALPQLSRWYDLDFRLADSSIGTIPLSGSMDHTLTTDRLDLIAASLGLRAQRSGRVVTLYRAEHPMRR